MSCSGLWLRRRRWRGLSPSWWRLDTARAWTPMSCWPSSAARRASPSSYFHWRRWGSDLRWIKKWKIWQFSWICLLFSSRYHPNRFWRRHPVWRCVTVWAPCCGGWSWVCSSMGAWLLGISYCWATASSARVCRCSPKETGTHGSKYSTSLWCWSTSCDTVYLCVILEIKPQLSLPQTPDCPLPAACSCLPPQREGVRKLLSAAEPTCTSWWTLASRYTTLSL